MTFLKKDESSNEVTGMGSTSLGGNISALRKAKGMTQEEFAEKLGVTPQAVSKWENSVSCPDIMLLPRIAEIFGVSIDELMGVRTPPKPEIEEATVKVNRKLKLRIHIIDGKNNKPVNISVPINFVARAAGVGMRISAALGNEALDGIPFDDIVEMAKNGITGEIFDLITDDGTQIKIEIS